MKTILSDKILVSIIVCCYNENDYIDSCLGSLVNQNDIKGKFEILVIDGMSTDGTREKIQKILRLYPEIKFFDNPAQVKPPAINIGFRNSAGTYIAICDAHTIYAEDYIIGCIRLLNKYPDVNCVGGPIVSIGKTNFGKANAIAMSSKIGVGNAKHRFPDYEGYAEMACFPVFRRNVLDTVGFYDEYFIINHDDEYCFRLRKAGGKVFLSPSVKSYYYVRNSITKLFMQYFSYGYWQIAFLKKHKEPISIRQLIPFTFFLVLILLIILSVVISKPIVGIFLPILYVIVLITAAIPVSLKEGIKVAINFPIAVFILHFSYAAGFVTGLFKFRKKQFT